MARAAPIFLSLALVACVVSDSSLPTPGPTPRVDPEPTPELAALPGVLVSEVLADNHDGLTLDGPVDWIELFNTEPQAVDLSGWGLSDDPDEPFAFEFPAGASIDPGGFVVVLAAGPDAVGELVAPFSLDAHGEEVLLTAPDGRLVDRLTFGAQREDISFGRPQAVVRTVLLGDGDAAPLSLVAPPNADWEPATLPVGYDAGGAVTSNLALGRVTTQSSDGYGRTGAEAVDGSLSTFSHTADADLDSWWEVDLGASASIGEVRIFNRVGCCPNRLYNLDVELLREDGTVAHAWDRFNPTSEGATPIDPGAEHSFGLDPSIVGRFVRVSKTAVGGAGSTEWMSLAEVEVTGAPAAPFADRIATDLEARMKGVTDRAWISVEPVREPPEDFEGVRRLVLSIEGDDAWRVHTADPISAGLEGDTVVGPASPTRAGELLLFEDLPIVVEGVNLSADDDDFLLAVTLTSEDIATAPETAHFRVPTPGAPNGPGFAGFVSDPTVDPPRSFYDDAFTATLSSDTPGATLVYTLDGSVPTLDHGTAVPGDATLEVSTTSAVRVAAFLDGWEPSRVVTHTWIFLEHVLLQPAAPPGFPTVWDGISQAPAAADYGMDPEVVDDDPEELLAGLRAIPSLSIVMPQADLFGAEAGIYVHSRQRGAAWERAASVELIETDGSTGFAVDCGVKVHGFGWRPHSNTRKHALRLEFRDRYGPRKLAYPLFPDAPVDRFDSIVLRSQGSRGWQDFRDPEQSQYLRDAFARDTARDMGKVDGHAAFVHLYLNGLYWGLYNPVERPDAGFGAEYFGGEAEDYDAINRRTTTNEAIDGTLDAYYELLARADGPVDTPAGLAAVEEMLDLDDLIDYMLIHQYTANRDGPERFNHNNMRGVRRRPDGRFRFFVWDMEYSLWYAGDDINIDVDIAGSISHVYARLRTNADFRARYGARAAMHLEGDGALTPAAALARYEARATEIETAILGESARWGDADREPPYTRDVEWIEERRRLTEEFFPQRTAVLIEQLRAAGLYP
jgi:hypothetical protein